MKNNIIDLSERQKSPEGKARLKDLKLRIDVEQAKVLVSTSLISVLFLVTLTNNNLMTGNGAFPQGSAELSSMGKAGGRGPDAVLTGTSDMEDAVVRRLAKLSLNETSTVGRAPTALEKLTIGFLEGKYAVRLENGKLRELEFSDAAELGDRPKYIDDRSQFLSDYKGLMPIEFDRSVRVETNRTGKELVETYDLLNRAGMPIAKARFMMDSAGRLISLKVVLSRLASN